MRSPLEPYYYSYIPMHVHPMCSLAGSSQDFGHGFCGWQHAVHASGICKSTCSGALVKYTGKRNNILFHL